MQKYRRLLRRRAIFLLVDSLVIILFLMVWMVARKPVPTGRNISYTRASNHILVQLAELPEHPERQMHTVPVWTLYGDGTLVFRTTSDDNLWLTHLSQSEIQHLLDVIVNQDTFFDSTAQRYVSMAPGNDDERLLTVNAYGLQKEVVLVSEPAYQVVVDLQTAHVFAIEQLLLHYHPLHTVVPAPNIDQEGDSDNRK